LGRVVHGADVFGRNVGLDIVNGAENVAAPLPHFLDAASYFGANFVGSSIRHVSVGVDAAPEGEVFAELALELDGVHSGC